MGAWLENRTAIAAVLLLTGAWTSPHLAGAADRIGDGPRVDRGVTVVGGPEVTDLVSQGGVLGLGDPSQHRCTPSGDAQPATLGDATSWQWEDGQTRRYLVRSHLVSPYVLSLLAEQNREIRAGEVGLDLVLSCRVHERLKKAVVLGCVAEDASVFAVPIRSNRGDTLPILQEYEALYERADIRVRMTPDGRIGDVRIRGIEANQGREAFIHDHARLYLERALTALDAQLPDEEAVPGDTWKHRNALAAKSPFTIVSMGSTRFEVTWSDSRDAIARFDGDGKGLAVVGEDNWEMSYQAESWFDTSQGMMSASRIVVVGHATASSPIAFGNDPEPYLLEAGAICLSPVDHPELLPTAEW